MELRQNVPLSVNGIVLNGTTADGILVSKYDLLEWNYDILHLFPFLSKYDCLEWNYDRLCRSQ